MTTGCRLPRGSGADGTNGTMFGCPIGPEITMGPRLKEFEREEFFEGQWLGHGGIVYDDARNAEVVCHTQDKIQGRFDATQEWCMTQGGTCRFTTWFRGPGFAIRTSPPRTVPARR